MAAKGPKHPKVNYLAGLPDDVVVNNIVLREKCDELYVSFKPPESRKCPRCGSSMCIVKDSGRVRSIRHIPIANRGSVVTFHEQRMLCKDCMTTYTERPSWVHLSFQMTEFLYFSICGDLIRMLSITAIADNHRVTSSVVMSVLDSIEFERPMRLPEILCIDEFKGDSGAWDPQKERWDVTKFHCNIADGSAGCVIDILPEITAEHVKQYFRRYPPSLRMDVKYFCCDMHNGFVSVAKELFPHAHICIDMFHVVKLINTSINSIRTRLQRDLLEEDHVKYKILKKAARSLVMSEDKQTRIGNPNNARRRQRLQTIFSAFPELAKAHEALQDFHSIKNEWHSIAKKASLLDWIKQYGNTSIPELDQLVRSIHRWRWYIYNTWEYECSNSICEGLNNKIKALKRISFGMHSFDTFRKRVLLTCGPIRLDNDPFTIFREKRNGKGLKL